jgi:DNA repair exonuclease SbcCD ATPase subunit
LITLAIGLLLALAFLAVFNARLQNRLTTLSDAQSAQIEILRADLTNLQGRIDALETIGARTAALESAQQEMTQSFAEIQDGFEQLQQTVNDLQETVAAQSQATARFSNFLQQLQALLNQTFSDSSQPEGAQ